MFQTGTTKLIADGERSASARLYKGEKKDRTGRCSRYSGQVGDTVRSMRILVTGARGFIGAAIVRHALSCGHEVVAFDLAARKRELPAEVQFILGDINAPVAWASK